MFYILDLLGGSSAVGRFAYGDGAIGMLLAHDDNAAMVWCGRASVGREPLLMNDGTVARDGLHGIPIVGNRDEPEGEGRDNRLCGNDYIAFRVGVPELHA